MYQNGTYGDELCIRSLADILKVTILVCTPQYGTLNFESPNSDNNHSVRIAYNGINHYDAVIYRHSPIISNHRYFSFRDKEVDSSYISQASPDQADKMMEKLTTDALEPLPGTQQPQPSSGSPDPDLHSNTDLVILSANITSWEPHSEFLLACGADILVMQETRLSLAGINNHTNRLSKRQQPWASVWGKPPGQIKVKHRFAKSSTGSSCHGGVGILTRTPHTFSRDWHQFATRTRTPRICTLVYSSYSTGTCSSTLPQIYSPDQFLRNCESWKWCQAHTKRKTPESTLRTCISIGQPTCLYLYGR